MTGTEELRSEKSQSQGAHERFFPLFITGREGQVWAPQQAVLARYVVSFRRAG